MSGKSTSSREAPRCATCRFWGVREHDDWESRDIGARLCEYAEEIWRVTTWSEDANKQVLLPEYVDHLAFTQDGSGYVAYLLTKADFGCVAHQAADAMLAERAKEAS